MLLLSAETRPCPEPELIALDREASANPRTLIRCSAQRPVAGFEEDRTRSGRVLTHSSLSLQCRAASLLKQDERDRFHRFRKRTGDATIPPGEKHFRM